MGVDHFSTFSGYSLVQMPAKQPEQKQLKCRVKHACRSNPRHPGPPPEVRYLDHRTSGEYDWMSIGQRVHTKKKETDVRDEITG